MWERLKKYLLAYIARKAGLSGPAPINIYLNGEIVPNGLKNVFIVTTQHKNTHKVDIYVDGVCHHAETHNGDIHIYKEAGVVVSKSGNVVKHG